MKKTILILGIIFLLVGVSIVSSTRIIVLEESSLPISPYKQLDTNSNVPTNIHLRDDTIDCSKKLFSEGKIAYGLNVMNWWGPCYFLLDDPGNITYLKGRRDPPFLSGGTWTNDGRWLCCEYYTGCLYEIDPKTGYYYRIGCGDVYVGLNGLAFNPITKKLYGASSYALYEIDIQTGKLDYIGPFNNDGQVIICITFDANGILYAWDVKFSGNSYLYTVNTETGQATQVGSMGMTLCFAQDGAFDYETDTLYLSAYIINPYYGGYLIECNEGTGNCTIIGPFEKLAELDALAIPYNWTGLSADFAWKPNHPEPNEIVLFNASKSFSPNGDITLYEWDWDNDGVFDENHTISNTTHSWSSIGFYKVTLRVTDNINLTSIQRKTIRIGNHPPNTPTIIGQNSGKPGEEYFYKFVLTDPDEDNIYLRIFWGDNNYTWWIGPYHSGEEEILSHTWSESGTYTIQAKTKDIYGTESDWTEYEVTITKSKSVSSSLLLRFLERYPLLQTLLMRLGLQ